MLRTRLVWVLGFSSNFLSSIDSLLLKKVEEFVIRRTYGCVYVHVLEELRHFLLKVFSLGVVEEGVVNLFSDPLGWFSLIPWWL